ncbi:MAG: cyclopropane-fatty-acyl-phospholipid synthase family protein [Pseudomonadota bacterium]
MATNMGEDRADISRRVDTRSALRKARLAHVCRKAVLSRFENLTGAAIEFSEGAQLWAFGSTSERFPETVRVSMSDPRAWTEIALNGPVGSGEAYMRGWWQCSDLVALVRLLLVHRSVLENLDGGLARLGKPVLKAWHWLQRNTRKGSRRNIQAHYDLGDAFFELFLDQTLSYSSAIFPTKDSSLEEGSIEKIDRICRKLKLEPGMQVLEIGSGWGALAVHAAQHYGVSVTTITLSDNQKKRTEQRAANAGLTEQIDVRLQDYRDVEGCFDRVISVEMIEAVGNDHLDTYFEQVDKLLAPDGMALIQAITISDQQFDQAVKRVDFIKRYIFPGGFLPSLTRMLSSMTRRTSLRCLDIEDIGFHYARTLELWRESFLDALPTVRAQGYSDVFIRMWEFYLCYCEAAFRERATSTVQMCLTKPDNRTVIGY